MRHCYPPIQFDLKCCHCQHCLKGVGVEDECPFCKAPVRDTWKRYLQQVSQGTMDGKEYHIEQEGGEGYPDLYIPYEDGISGHRWDRLVRTILILVVLLLGLLILLFVDLGFNHTYMN